MAFIMFCAVVVVSAPTCHSYPARRYAPATVTVAGATPLANVADPIAALLDDVIAQAF